MTVAEILGCASATNKRLRHDAYQTPDWVVEQLCGAERLPSQIWEPCAGEGQLARVLRQHGSKVIETDLDPRKRSQRRLDFLAARRPLAKAIVTNPPYRIATKFIRHALSLRYGQACALSANRTGQSSVASYVIRVNATILRHGRVARR